MAKEGKNKEQACACGEDCKCKKGKVRGVIFTILLVLAFAVIAFGVGVATGGVILVEDEKVENKEDVNEEVNEETNEEISDDAVFYVNEQVVEKALEEYYFFAQQDKMFESPEKINLNDLLLFSSNKLVGELTRDTDANDVTLDEVNKVIKENFGYEIKEGADIFCDVCENITFTYDSSKKVFSYKGEHGHEGSPVSVLQRIISVRTNEKGQVVVLVKQAYGLGQYYISKYYRTPEDARNEMSPILEIHMEESGMTFEQFDFNGVSGDKMNTYEYVFEKSNHRLILKSYKRV